MVEDEYKKNQMWKFILVIRAAKLSKSIVPHLIMSISEDETG
jgi:hypothetical protein